MTRKCTSTLNGSVGGKVILFRPWQTVALQAIFALGVGNLTTQAAATQSAAGETLTLEQAIARAQVNEPLFAAAVAERRALALERTNAKAALLPTVTYHNLAIYTQPNGVPASRIGQTTNAPAPLFIANNAVREYASQGVFDEKIGLSQFASVRLADANAARAAAEYEVARRGLVASVVNLFYGAAGGAQKVGVAVEAKAEAEQFLEITQKREAAREVAHADVLKAQLQQQSRERELTEAKAAVSNATVELGTLLYSDPVTPYQVQTESAPVLPNRPAIETLARKNNPDIRSALAVVSASQANSATATAALFPDLALNFTYGIDATNFGVNGPDGIRNLGYSMSATLDIPVWNWLSTERSIKTAHLRETAAKTALTAAQRRLLASLSQFYTEAEVAHKQLASLEASVVTARESLRLTRLRYIQGESTVLEVVDAQSTLIAAQNAEIDGELRYRLALANLQTLTGTL